MRRTPMSPCVIVQYALESVGRGDWCLSCELTCVIHLTNLLETPELALNPLKVLLGADRSEDRLRTLALGQLDGEEGASVAAQRLEAAVCEGTRRAGRRLANLAARRRARLREPGRAAAPNIRGVAGQGDPPRRRSAAEVEVEPQ